VNVYKICLANPDIVLSMKQSVLYRIAAPNFPADLREYLFESGDIRLDQIRNADIRELLRKYKDREVDQETDEIKRFFRRNQLWVQVAQAHDRITLCMRDLERHKENISTVGGGLKWANLGHYDHFGRDFIEEYNSQVIMNKFNTNIF
jgi:hypothetical protein